MGTHPGKLGALRWNLIMKSIAMITTLAAAVMLTAGVPMLRAADQAPVAPATPEIQKKTTEVHRPYTPEEKEALKKAQQARMEERLALLEKKKAAGKNFTAADQQQLQRLQQLKANGWKPLPPPMPTAKKDTKTPEKIVK